MEQTARQIYRAVMQAEKILLVTHQNPDGDAVGCISAFSYFLRDLAKKHHNYCFNQPAPRINSLPHIININTDPGIWREKHDLVVVLDSGDFRHAAIDSQIREAVHGPTVINIDHHETNSNFGHFNLVIKTASSASEVLYYFFKYNNVPLNKNIAAALLTGIITDTENFTNPGTNINCLKIASDLIHRGANFNQIKTWFLKDKTLSSLKLWGIAFSRLNKNEACDIIYSFITRKDLKENNLDESETEGIANFMNNLGDCKASLLLKEKKDGLVKGSLRTTRDDFDAAGVARALGGGGHRKAAGFTMEGSVDEVLNKVWLTIAKNSKMG